MTIVWSRTASDELDAYYNYVRQRSPAFADDAVERVCRTIEALAAREFEGAPIELVTGEVVRSWPAPPLRIFYQVGDDDVLVVVHVYDQRGRPLGR